MDILEIRKLFDFCPSTGVLTWSKRDKSDFKTELSYFSFAKKLEGKEPGCESKSGYKVLRFGGKNHYYHRICFAIYYGFMPNIIDHINGNRSDNRICNLRPVTHKQNAKNRKVCKRNKTGIIGVRFVHSRKRFRSTIKVDGKTKHLAYTSDFFEACCIRKSAEIKYGFHANHGKR